MKLATFNIYWLGGNKIQRTAVDTARIAGVLARLNADVVAFQEIVDPAALQDVLDLANSMTSRNYRIRDADDQLLGGAKSKSQKVFMTYDDNRYELLAASSLLGSVGRRPFGLRVRSRDGGGQVLVVGVHLKSGQPQFADPVSAERRKQECQFLSDWIAGGKAAQNPRLPMPLPGEHAALLGDFNALYDSDSEDYAGVVASLEPLRAGAFAGWRWEKPLADPNGGDRTTSYLERLLIDFVMLSPSLQNRVVTPPTIYAFDRDPAIGAAGVSISDHRPVHVVVDLSP